ncbi:hypothetical protein FRB97_006658 [Tulasnella sp. 331]|nr:hypothetical protein FRB97_006658 [Tulasnella sp. 331]
MLSKTYVEFVPFRWDNVGGWKLTVTAVLGSLLILQGLGRMVRRLVLMPKFTIMDDIPSLGRDRKDGKIAGRAVICGGSVAGLFAAAVCSHHFDSVVIIEPEQSANEHAIENPKPLEFRTSADGKKRPIAVRSRIGQYFAIHAFLPPIILALERLFPTFDKELDFFGIKPIAFMNRMSYGNVPIPAPFESDDPRAPKILPITRGLFEALLRRLVVKHVPNITFLSGSVDRLEPSAPKDGRLAGVRVRTQQGEKFEPATLVVDATGPSQASYHKWLKNAGFPSLPRSIEYDPRIYYGQSVWKIPAKLRGQIDKIIPSGFQPGIIYNAIPDWSTGEQTAFAICVFEGSQLYLTTAAWDSGQAPKSLTELRVYIQSMVSAERTAGFVFELLDFLEVHEEEISPWFFDAMIGKMSYIQYHEAKGLPSNWVAIGDASMKLNPIYGQGCTKAMIDAVTLDTVLHAVTSYREHLPSDFSEKFFKKQAPRIQGLWDGTKNVDYGFSGTKPAKGDSLKTGSFQRNFGRYVLYTSIAACKDAAVDLEMLREMIEFKLGLRTRSASSRSYPPSDPPAYTDEDARALFDIPHPPRYFGQTTRLRLPLAVPQSGTGINDPFVRAYAPELSASGIDQLDWLKFCDGLNIAMAATPPLRVLDTAGIIIGFVYHWALIAGPIIQVGARAGAHALSKGLTDRYLRIANEDFFAPRGLRVRLCKTEAMRRIVGEDTTQPSGNQTLKKVGNSAERIGLHLPIIRNAIVMFHPAPTIDTSRETDVTRRRVAAVQGYVLPLEYDVPPAELPPGMMDKVSATLGKVDKWRNMKSTNDTDKARRLLTEQQAYNAQAGRSQTQGGVLGIQLARDVILDKLSPNSRGGGSTAKVRTKVAIANRKEVAKTVAILWIVVLNEEQDKQIQDTELVDSKVDIEEIEEMEWEEELRREGNDDMRKLKP